MKLLRSISRIDLGRPLRDGPDDIPASGLANPVNQTINDLSGPHGSQRARSGFRFVGPAEVESGRLHGADLSAQNLDSKALPQADLRQASLRHASLKGAQLHKADFTEADCSGADFSKGNLKEATFVLATLTGAVFRNANLAGANFYAANLSGADFTDAIISGARFPDVRWDPGSTKFPPDAHEQLLKVSVRVAPRLYRVGSMRDDRTTIPENA
jgi:hypothetical protein